MFKLESYITPLLMGYIDKYVKLKHEDFQLSLWGGDVVLNKLDIRLDIIEQALKLPVTIKSGFVHELRIHVPWTRLYSEPVVITINTIECILNLNRNQGEVITDVSRINSDSQMPLNNGTFPAPSDGTDGEDLPPGYLQSLATKILHNISVVINNLVLKFVEEDIVLSVNIKSAECYSVDSDWNRSFVELALPDLALRRVIDFHDLTLCLDKRNASGKIESYQDPMLYRCSLTCRLLMQYKSVHAKLPITTILNILNERLDVSLTDVQLPMFRRLIELSIALYYGTIDPASGIKFVSREDSKMKPATMNDSVSKAQALQQPEKEPEGWASWAWSYVPQLAAADEEEEEEENLENVRKKVDTPVFIVGVYITQTMVLFKQSLLVEKRRYSSTSAKSSAFKSFLALTINEIGLEVTFKDTTFFDVQFGMTDMQLCGVGKDGTMKKIFAQTVVSKSPKEMNYMTGCLFADIQSNSRDIVFEECQHVEKYNEKYVMDRYGCFWMNYLFTAVPRDTEESKSIESPSKDILERSCQRYFLGPTQICVSSTSVDHVRRIIDSLNDYDYEPYGHKSTVDTDHQHRPSRSLPTQSDVQRFEGEISAVTYQITILRPCVCIERAGVSVELICDTSAASSTSAIVLEAAVLSFSSSRAMYDRDTSEIGSMISSPSPQLLRSCHSHMNFQLSRIEVNLALVDDWPNNAFTSSLCNVMQPFNATLNVTHLLHPRYWKNILQPQCEYIGDVETFSVNLTMGQIFVLIDIAWSWLPGGVASDEQALSLSLLDDVFSRVDERQTNIIRLPVMEFSLSGLHLQYMMTEAVNAATGGVASARLFILRKEEMRDCIVPIIFGPANVSTLHAQDLRSSNFDAEESETSKSLITFTCQMPRNVRAVQAPAIVYVKSLGVILCLDPIIHDWFSYTPTRVGARLVRSKSKTSVTLDTSLVSAAFPLSVRSSQVSESEHVSGVPGPFGGSVASLPITPHPLHAKLSVSVPEHEVLMECKKETQQSESKKSFSQFLADCFPFIKIVDFQMEVDPCCAFFPSKHICFQEPTVDIGLMILDMYQSKSLPDTLVLCGPSIHVSSSGRKQETIHRTIPVRSLDKSLSGDKLPWLVKLHKCSAYTVHDSREFRHLLKPTSLSGTLSVTGKYRDPLSDSISQLNSFFHTDMSLVILSLSNAQIQLISELINDGTNLFCKFIESVALVMPEKNDDVEGGPHLLGSDTHRSVQDLQLFSGTSNDPHDSGIFPISESSEKVSFELLQDRRFDDDGTKSGKIKLTFWMQCTLPKLTIALYGRDRHTYEIMCVLTKFEDLIFSADIHKVFAKIKCSVGAVNVNHRRIKGDVWEHDGLNGILLSSSEILTRNTRTILPPNLIPSRTSRHPSMSEETKNSEQASGFVSVVFTRALAENVRRKMDVLNDAQAFESEYRRNMSVKYLNEVCVNCQPFDVVCNGRVLAALFDIFSFPAAKITSNKTEHVKEKATKFSHDLQPMISAQLLPLLYVNASGFRLFIPCEPDSSARATSTVSDVCVIQCASISLTPHAVNPLPRFVVDNCSYTQHQFQAKVSNVPGNSVEDRQYDITFHKISIATACWKELVSRDNEKESDQFHKVSKGQNPALEWNTSCVGESQEEVIFVPIITQFDLKITFAPPIVKRQNEDVVICGYSTEINVTSDLNIILSVDQITLLTLIFERMSSELNQAMSDETVSSRESQSVFDEPVRDLVNENSESFKCTPFDILVTARKLSAMLYSRQSIVSDDKISPDATGGNLDKSLNSGTISAPKDCTKIVPFVYLYISQPHAIVKFDTIKLKSELAVHDCVVKGSLKDDYRIFEEDRLIPHVTDYPVYWLETRSGKPDSNSGLLPGLFMAFVDVHSFQRPSVDVEFVLGRPVAINCSLSQLDQALVFSSRIVSVLYSDDIKDKSPQEKLEHHPNQASVPPWLHKISVNTEQFVIVMDTRPMPSDDSPTSVQLALSKFQASTVFQLTDTKITPKIVGDVQIQNLLAKVAVARRYRSFVSPFNLDFSVCAYWLSHSGTTNEPRIVVSAKSSCVQVQVLPEIVQSLMAFQGHIFDHLSLILSRTIDENPGVVVTKEKKAVSKNSGRKLELNPATESIDDLRSGWFAYNTEQCEAAALNPGEISFHTDAKGNNATMTWRYNECRTLTYLKVSPVPFSTQNINAFANVNSNEDLKVRCIVQHSQSCSGRFEDYVEFYLCENSVCIVALPEQNDSAKIVATDVWRILIRYPKFCDVGVENRESKDPIVSPLVLAASIQVNSAFVRQLVPALQLELSLMSISVRLFNSSYESKSGALSVLNSYTFVPSLHSHEMLVLGIDDVSFMVSGFESEYTKVHARVVARVYCNVLEYRSLTMLPMLKPCTLAARLEKMSVDKTTKLSAEVQLDRILIRVSRSIVWTLNQIANIWNPSSANEMDDNLSTYYIICNDTQETIYFGQTETNERIAVPSRCATQYAWRTHKRKQMLRLALVDVDLSTCQDIDIDTNNVIPVFIKRPNGRETSLVARITTFSNTQNKIVVSGRIFVSNLLSQSLEIKLLTTYSIIESNRCLPSFVLENSTALPSLKVRLVGAETSWSTDVNVSVANDGQLVRLQSTNRKDYIHVWCHVIEQTHKNLTQSLVVFSPLFVVSSQLSSSLLVNIESPTMQGVPTQLGLEGRGSKKQLELYGGSVVHNLTFQLNPTMPTSSPAISLSADTIQQVNRRFLDTTDLFAISAELLVPNDGRDWPYNDVDDSVRADVLDKFTPSSSDVLVVVNVNVRSTNSIDDTIPDFEQPNISVHVNLIQRWPHLSTLLIDVVPSWLFVNQLCFDVILSEQNGRPWRVPAGKSFAPPAFSEAFNVGILLGGRVHKSAWLTLCCEDDTKRYLPRYDGLLYQEGHLQVNVPIVLNGVVIQLGCLSVHSTFKHQMRILTVREQFSFCSTVKRNLDILCVGVRSSGSGHRAHINDECVATVTVKADDVDTIRPLLLWNVLTQEPQQVYEESVALEFVLYMAVRFSKSFNTKSLVNSYQCVDKWSIPVKLKASKAGKRLPVAIPIVENGVGNTTSCALTGQLSLGIVYLCLAEDRDPGMQVHNNCLQKLYFGQAVTESNRSGFVVQEELREILNLPNVESGCLCHYTMPAIVAQFPSTDNTGAAMPKLHLGASTSNGDIHWSRGIDLQTDHSIFVNIPELFDVKVSVRKLRYTLHIYIDSVSRAEISAKEVRSRIKKNVIVETNSKIGVPTSPGPEDGNRSSLALFVRPSSTSVEDLLEVNVVNSSVQIICDRACLILIDESSQPTIFSEVLRVTLNKLSASLYPTLDIVNSTSSRPLHMRNFLLTVYDMQVDNQLFGKTCYDFPVSFMKQFVSPRGDDLDELEKFSFQEQISWFKSHSLISMSGELCGGQGVFVQSLAIAIKPIQLFIEDAYIWYLLRVIDKIIPIRCAVSNHLTKDSSKLPTAIKCNHAVLISPLRIEHLCLEPVSVLVSLRATLKMFIATNGTPLYFGRFEMTNVCSTVPQVVRSVTMHYASAAIFRAGLVVGSLEILGNPTGFVRHVGDGVADMFCMPYRGLTVGPGAFLAGITRGMASITRHLSVGTLTSITNFASSVSRNMEQLSLDSDHIHRSELIRMRRPSGLSDGLRNGLTGFGLSMLGAIAGIADQPLQIFTRNQLDHASSASHARGLLRGFGKGLVGIVTKPIGGAAELVSQTSLGMLQQVGLKDNTPPKHKPSEKLPSAFKNSSAKHSIKIAQVLVDRRSDVRGEPEVLAHVDASTSSVHIPSVCTLVLTSDYLLVIDIENDQLILTLPISEIECRKSRGCSSTIKVVCISADNTMKNAQHARIAAFIDEVMPVEIDETSSKYLNASTRQSDVIAASPAADSPATPNVYCFKTSRVSDVDHFLSQFSIVRSSVTKHGFSM